MLALIIAVIGAALLGTVLACTVQQDAGETTTVEREQAVEITEGSSLAPVPTPTPVPIPQDKLEDADTACALAKLAVETLGHAELSKARTIEYIPEEVTEHYTQPACWIIRDDSGETSIFVQIDEAAKIVQNVGLYMPYPESPDFWGPATVEEGEAVLRDPSAVLADATARVQAFAPNETVRETWLRSVYRQQGYLFHNVCVTTDAEVTHTLDLILMDGNYVLEDYHRASGVVEKHEAHFTDNDVDAWMWQLESFDAIQLVNPRRFEHTDPKDAAIRKTVIESRCKSFYVAATGKGFFGTLKMQFFKDLSGEREDYYAVSMEDGGNTLKLALSAETGDLLAWQGELSVQPLLMEGAGKLWDWDFGSGPEFEHALRWFEDAMATLCKDALKEVSLNAVADDFYMTLDAIMTTGRFHEFRFEIKDGKALLEGADCMFSEDAFMEGYMVPWEADVRVIDPNSGDIKLGWFGPEKLGAALLP